MVKKIKFSLILLLLVFITLGAVSAAEDVNTTADNNLISDSAYLMSQSVIIISQTVIL